MHYQEENKALRQASVHIQAKAEQEEEFISNTLLKKIQALKKEKESLALNYEQEEEMLTNDLSRKLNQLRQVGLLFIMLGLVELESSLESWIIISNKGLFIWSNRCDKQTWTLNFFSWGHTLKYKGNILLLLNVWKIF